MRSLLDCKHATTGLSSDTCEDLKKETIAETLLDLFTQNSSEWSARRNAPAMLLSSQAVAEVLELPDDAPNYGGISCHADRKFAELILQRLCSNRETAGDKSLASLRRKVTLRRPSVASDLHLQEFSVIGLTRWRPLLAVRGKCTFDGQ